jgi:hypothetical protein
MERAYDLDQRELSRAAQLQQENQTLLARFGAATLEIETCRAAFPKLLEKQRELINDAVQRHGVESFLGARIEGRHVVCQMPDSVADGPSAPVPIHKANGGIAIPAEKE